MSISIMPGTIEEVIEVESGIPEFGGHRSRETYAQRLNATSHLILIAKDGERPVGFKVCYALDRQTVYSWVGGVLPGYRRLGLAQQMLEIQEAWAAHGGYTQIHVKTMNRFSGMLILLIKNNYQIISVEGTDGPPNCKILFAKRLTD